MYCSQLLHDMCCAALLRGPPREASAHDPCTTFASSMYYASWAIALACGLLWVGRHELSSPLERLSSVHLTVDGNAVVGGPFSEGLRPWVLVTALFHHASRSHVVNNTLMLLATGGELERGIGSLPLLAAFVAAGVAGWLATLLYYKIVLAEAWAGGIAQMQPSVGSSPGTYGLVVLAAVVLPPDTGAGAALWLPAWAACALQLFVPKFFGDGFGVDLATEPFLSRVLPAATAAAAFSYFALRPLLTHFGCGPAEFFGFYLFGVTIPPAIRDWLKGKVSSADHPCHLGGALLALALGFGISNQPWEAGWWVTRQGLLVAVSLVELTVRVALDAAGKLAEGKSR